MALFTVFGSPIKQSLSPQIHAAFADEFGLLNEYGRSLSSSGRFVGDVAQFFRRGGAGANVTMPFKDAAFALVTHTTARARQAAAVNTLIPLGHGQLLGDSTDGLGLYHDLRRLQGAALAGRSVTVIGAGGAARSAIYSLLELADIGLVQVLNRTPAKAAAIVAEGAAQYGASRCRLGDWDAPVPTSVIINATGVALQGQQLALPDALWTQAELAYDMTYAAKPTAFMESATSAGVEQVSDGLGMLVEQAALSFALWHDGLMPRTAPVLSQLRQLLTQDAENHDHAN